MSQSALMKITLYIFYFVFHLTSPTRIDSIYDKTQHMIIYINSESISQATFTDSFSTFTIAFKSVLSDTLPSLSPSFNLTNMHIWCLPTNSNIFSAFYASIHYKEPKNEATNHTLLTSITNLITNDLFSQILLNALTNTNPISPLLSPNPFLFATNDIILSKNISFIDHSHTDCLTYLSDTQHKRSQNTLQTTQSIPNTQSETVIDHDNDDFIQFFVYGITVHWQVFLTWSILCIFLGITLCTAIFCLHIYIVEKQRIQRKKKRRKRRRKHTHSRNNSNYLEQTPSVYTSTITIDNHQTDPENNIIIERPLSAKTNVTEITESDISHHRTKSKSSLRSVNIRRKRKKRRSKYDIIPAQFYTTDEELDLKQEELYCVSNERHSINNPHSLRRNSTETLHTNNTENKVVTVHVHHHYNPNPSAPIEYNIGNDDGSVHSREHKENEHNYPDLPYDRPNNLMYNPQLGLDINNIISVDRNGNAKKELSKSQREGFSPYTKPKSRHSYSYKKGIRKSIASQCEDNVSDSELMYAPGPAADDTPGVHRTPHTGTPLTYE